MKKNNKAKFLLMQSLDEYYSEVDDKKHACEIWSYLVDVYAISTIGGRLRLRSLWDQRRLQSGESPTAFINDIERLRKDYNNTVEKDSGVEKISESSQLYKLLTSLPPDWDSFRIPMTLRSSNGGLTYREAKANFLEEAATREQTAASERAMQTLIRQAQRASLNAKGARRGDSADRQQAMDEKKKTHPCHHCGKLGHWKGDPACTRQRAT
jgi:hypothetical protein